MTKKHNIMITGGTGFIGSHLVEEFISENNNIFVPYIKNESKSYFSIRNLKKSVHLIKIDLRDQDKLNTFLLKNNIEFIFHLAAQTIVEDAYEAPYDTLYNNIISTLNILEFARKNRQVKGVIIASSDKAYGKTKGIYNEDSPLNGDHPYDVSKSSKDLIAQTYYKTYKTPVVITRFGNVYGEGDLHLNRIVPGICEAVALDKNLNLRSNGTFVRDYIYVKDVVNAYVFLYKKFNTIKGEAFNVSSNDKLSVIDLLKKVEKRLGREIKYKVKNTAKNEIPYQHLNWRKIQELGWNPRYSIDSQINNIFEWYSRNIFNN